MKYLFTLCFLFLGLPKLLGQQYDELDNYKRTADTTVYYININSSMGDSQLLAFHGGKIGVLFQDKFGVKETVNVQVTSLSRGESRDFEFAKNFGSNEFVLEDFDLSELDSISSFVFSIQDDMGKKYKKMLTVNPIKDENKIFAEIIKSPITIDCNIPTNTKIEYFSDVKGGKAPYLVEWGFGGVAEDTQEIIPIQGYSSAVLVDLPPPYFISLKVTDSCGEVTFQTVQVACDTSSPTYNSILFNVDPSKKRSIEK